jgi:hypothetical protein
VLGLLGFKDVPKKAAAHAKAAEGRSATEAAKGRDGVEVEVDTTG